MVEELDRIGWPRAWWEAPQIAYVGVMAAGGLLSSTSWGGDPPGPLGHSIDEIGAIAEAKGIRQVWLHESALPVIGLPAGYLDPALPPISHPLIESCGPYQTRGRPGLSAYSNWWVKDGHAFTLHVPAWEDGSPFAGAETGFRLLADVSWYEHATGGRALWRGGPHITSDNVLRDTYRSRRRKVDLRVTDRPEPVERGFTREARWYWSREPSAEEANYRHCHALDLNSAYATVAGSLSLPVGEAELFQWPAFRNVPGVWLIEPEPWAERRLPAPWADDHRRDRPGPYWVTTPTMERASQLGVEPLEAWIWPEHHHYMRAWYELVRDARAELLDVGGAALRAVKDIPQRGVGRLASRRRSKALDVDELFQPYWSWSVIAECRQRLHRRLTDVMVAHGVAPVAIDTDCVYYLSSRATPEILAIRLGLPLGEGLGQFKAVGSCKASDARAALAGADPVRRLRDLVKS